MALALSVSVLLAVNVRTQEAIEVERISASGYGGAKEGLAERIAASWLGLPHARVAGRTARIRVPDSARRALVGQTRRLSCISPPLAAAAPPWPPFACRIRPPPLLAATAMFRYSIGRSARRIRPSVAGGGLTGEVSDPVSATSCRNARLQAPASGIGPWAPAGELAVLPDGGHGRQLASCNC